MNTKVDTPNTEQIREHFGFDEDVIIERIPYSTIFALVDGTLLWDKANGYADLSQTVHAIDDIPPVTVAPKRKELTSIIYLTGPQGSGKSTLVCFMENATEIIREDYISFTDLSREINTTKSRSVLVVTGQYYDMGFATMLKTYTEAKGLKFINLKIQ